MSRPDSYSWINLTIHPCHGPVFGKSKLKGNASNFDLFCMAVPHCYILTSQAIKNQKVLGKEVACK